jgi:hypothetical protein
MTTTSTPRGTTSGGPPRDAGHAPNRDVLAEASPRRGG